MSQRSLPFIKYTFESNSELLPIARLPVGSMYRRQLWRIGSVVAKCRWGPTWEQREPSVFVSKERDLMCLIAEAMDLQPVKDEWRQRVRHRFCNGNAFAVGQRIPQIEFQ